MQCGGVRARAVKRVGDGALECDVFWTTIATAGNFRRWKLRRKLPQVPRLCKVADLSAETCRAQVCCRPQLRYASRLERVFTLPPDAVLVPPTASEPASPFNHDGDTLAFSTVVNTLLRRRRQFRHLLKAINRRVRRSLQPSPEPTLPKPQRKKR